MRTLLLSTLIVNLFLFFSNCSTPTSPGGKEGKDQVNNTEAPAGKFILENLLKISDEKELIEKYGKENVKYDTIWGAEGEFTMGTVLFPKTNDEVDITWNDSLNRNLTAATIKANYDTKTDKIITATNWKTRDAITLGTTLEEILKLNGKDFTLYGFGWDYGGSVNSWEKGKLEPKGISIIFGESNEGQRDLTEDEYTSILGDGEFTSANPLIRKYNPVVLQLSVYRPN